MKSQKLNKTPNLNFEKKIAQAKKAFIIGVDEAGRGPWAGPLYCAALMLPQNWQNKNLPEKINDSKKLSPQQREKIYKLFKKNKQVKFALGKISAKKISKIGLAKANKKSMKKAVKKLLKKIYKTENHKNFFILYDGNKIAGFYQKNSLNIIKGDNKCASIAAASIIAKVKRDKFMLKLSKKYPGYGFEKHKGYGTKLHQLALKKLHPCPHHRTNFKPIEKTVALLIIFLIF